MGTPAYMSPEHLKGSARIDERSDVYGFGVLLYEALTGQIPFPGEPGPELFNRILNQPPPPLAALRPDLPAGLVGIVEKAMAKTPEDRYSNLNLLLGSIEDELAPTTPAPRVLTPIAGCPSLSCASVRREVLWCKPLSSRSQRGRSLRRSSSSLRPRKTTTRRLARVSPTLLHPLQCRRFPVLWCKPFSSSNHPGSFRRRSSSSRGLLKRTSRWLPRMGRLTMDPVMASPLMDSMLAGLMMDSMMACKR